MDIQRYQLIFFERGTSMGKTREIYFSSNSHSDDVRKTANSLARLHGVDLSKNYYSLKLYKEERH
ncbi:hypothetical protein BGC07_17780 [Piscirickettsia litoralis]|uniref:Uncharacterized protein n=2 Tax=Piscirickettsia litoralis TaxID=1891921 RepID=A0ABX3A0Z0_9GAMM|nr:hypothetical protein BGC07_17780 [Piscirickettsia litoralis]